MGGEPQLHALKFDGTPPEIHGEELGTVDLGAIGGVGVRAVTHLAWEAAGRRLAVGWTASTGVEIPSDANTRSNLEAHVSILATTTSPSLRIRTVGQLQGHSCGTSLGAISFSQSVPGAALLTAAWQDGHTTLLPLYV
uniref:Uncharacterized protein n=1 Tax=Chrysotila carterae TaxID=13221 RepID=A0A7S4C691_CHRCT